MKAKASGIGIQQNKNLVEYIRISFDHRILQEH